MIGLGRALRTSRVAQATEIALVFLVAAAVVAVGWRLVGANPLGRQAVVWVANILMLVTVWIGLRLRAQTWEHFGLSLRWNGRRALGRTVLQSIVVCVLALAAFVVGTVAMKNVTVAPAGADLSGYNYLQGNLPLLLLALAAVYVVSSFGEEMLYRGFLINRLAEIGSAGRLAWSVSIVTSAVVFGLAHFDWGIVGIVQTAFMGLALAISYLVTKRNLWALVLAHAYIDTLLLVQMYSGVAPP
ncbi:MAG TPA: type II CAAX endopeptidase family protein, partial [Gemmatimonadales bacterium]|jgi:membrane protease YdiL (CAAX protease family)|nr:type II CAAX endopeptidase family protein [Gemmatimonadales bacterium]